MYKRELSIFFNAVTFLTRIRVPGHIAHSPELLEETPRYYPVVGMIVGLISSAVYLLTDMIFNPDIAVAAAIIAGIFTTGAFHEDGFADVCDAFGGGWTKEKILTIMKDSRLGSFGVIGLIGILTLKFLLIRELFEYTNSGSEYGFINPEYQFIIGIFLCAHASSRLMPQYMLRKYPYVADIDASKSKPITKQKPTATKLSITGLFAVLPFTLIGFPYLAALIPMSIATLLMGRFFGKWIGGYTGDCLGAIQQVTEILFYAGAVLVFKFVYLA